MRLDRLQKDWIGKYKMSTNISSPQKAELVHKIAQKVYIEGKKQHAVAKELGISSPSTVSRLLSYGWETGILTLGYNPDAGRGIERDPDLEMALNSSFHLQNALVIRSPYTSEYDLEVDNRLHQSLGSALANHLKVILRSGDHIGVGGGRANYETAKALYEQRPLPLKDVTVTSLIGRLSSPPQWPSGRGPHTIDADDVSFMMAAAFQDAVSRPISMSLALPSSSIVAELKATGSGMLLAEEKWNELPDQFVPDIALVGVGSLDPRSGHAFRHLNDLAIDSIREPLEELVGLMKSGYCPVGDIASRLFFVAPPPGIVISKETKAKVNGLIDEINANLLCVTFNQLRKINKVIVTAGGLFKVNALFTLLSLPDPIIHELCTDETTARQLLERSTGDHS